MKKEVSIVCFSDIFWDAVWQRHQNLLTSFPKDWNILFIEPTSLVVLLKEPRRFFSQIHDNITIISLPSLPLIDKVSWLRFINDHLVLYWLRLMFKIKRISRPALLYYESRYSSLIGMLGECTVAYDCADDRMAFSHVPQWMKYYVEYLFNKANIVFTTSESLRVKAMSYRQDNVYLIGNGVNADLFKKSIDMPVPEDIIGIQKPIIGYFGVIDEWMDVDLVSETAAAYPDASLVLLGPVLLSTDRLQKLKSQRNIVLTGKKAYKELPGYLKAFDVCIIPFKVNELTKSVNPVKLYEYMAGGKNVVSTALPEVKQYGDIVYIAEDHTDFIRKIGIALATKPDIERMNAVIGMNSWNNKARSMADELKKCMRA